VAQGVVTRRSADSAPHWRRSVLIRQTCPPVSSCARISSLFAVYPFIGSPSRGRESGSGRPRAVARRAGIAPPAVVRDDWSSMSDERPSEVLGGLPHTRPHRRSQKRGAPAGSDAKADTATGARVASGPATRRATKATKATPPPAPIRRPSAPRSSSSAPGATKRATPSPSRVRQPAQPPGTPPAASSGPPIPGGGVDLIGSAVHVTAELAEIGISAGARALRGVVARLPKP
jgi:hypothetical protein